MPDLQILNFDGDKIVRAPGGTPVLIDAGSNAEVVFGDNPPTELRVNFPFGGRAATDSIGIRLGVASGITAPGGLAAGEPIMVGGTQIGTIGNATPNLLTFQFLPDVTPAQLAQLIRALTYSDTSTEVGFREELRIRIFLTDNVDFSINDARIADNVVGTDEGDSFTATTLNLNAGDRLAGGDGDDTLTLTGGGTFKLDLMDEINGVETIQGTAADDEIVIAGDQLGDVRRIDGRGATSQDSLTITGTADLTAIDVIGFGRIKIGSHGSNLTVGDVATAQLVTGYDTTGDSLTLTEGVLTPQERQALHLRGVDTIVAREVEGGAYVTTTHHAPTVANFAGNYVNAVPGTPVFIDFNRDAQLTVDDGRLRSLSVHVTGDADPGEVIGIATSARLTLSSMDNPTFKTLHFDGIVIGLVEGWGSPFLSITFDTNTTASVAQEVLRSLTYTRPDSAFWQPRTIDVLMIDVGERRTEAQINVLRSVTGTLTDGRDNLVGGGIDDIFEATVNTLTGGDQLFGNGGTDALQLSATSSQTFDLTHLDRLSNIEIIRGSAYDDVIRVGAAQLIDVSTIDGGGRDGTILDGSDGDVLELVGGTQFNLTWKTVTNFEKVLLTVDGTEVRVDTQANAHLIDGRSTKNDHLVLVGIDLSDAEREAYFARGIDKITDGSERTTENLAPTLTGVDGDHIRLSAGRSVVIDLESDGTLSAEDDDLRLLTVSVTEKHGAGDTALEIRTGNGISLSAGLDPGSEITVDGVTIGTIAAGSDRWGIRVAFTDAAIHSLVQKLIRALVYKNTATDNFLAGHDTVELVLVDEGGRASTAEIDVTITPNIVAFFTEGVDHVVGTGENEIFVAPTNTITAGDTLDGGGGIDTLVLGDGPSDLTLFATLTRIEALEGSSDDQTITANAANLAGIATIRGGGGEDRFLLMAGDYNFSGKTIEGVEALSLQGTGTLTFNDRATALLAGAVAGATASVDLTGEAVFTLAERIRLFRQGIASIKDASGTYTNADPDGISLSAATIRELARAGTTIGTLSATDPNQGDTFTYRLLDTAGGRFKLVREGDDWTIKVANPLLLDYEQARTHTIRVKVTDQEGGSFERDLTVTVSDIRGERASGSARNDKLYGSIGKDAFSGGGGNDTLKGGSDNDTLTGGSGNDVLYGGTGRDIFVFNTALNASSNKDRIMDWSKVDDTIKLENAVFKALKKTGTLSKNVFKLGSKATDADDHIGYNKATGDLWYDSNGNKAGGQVVFAHIGKNKAIAHNDFIVI